MSQTPPPPPGEDGPDEQPGTPEHGEATPPGYGAPPPADSAPPPPPGYGAPPPPGYGGGPGYGPPAGGPQKANSKAVGSLVVGVISPILGFCCAFIGLVGIVAVVLGRQAQREIVASNGTQTGSGMAKAGVILGIIGAAIGVLMTILNIVVLATGGGSFDFTTIS